MIDHQEIVNKIQIPVTSRGIGLDRREGSQYKWERYQKNLSMFVKTRNDGELIMEMLYQLLGRQIGSYLDYRPHEPNWIQIKLFEIDGINIEALDKLNIIDWQILKIHVNKGEYKPPINEIHTCVTCKKEFDPGILEPHVVQCQIICDDCYRI